MDEVGQEEVELSHGDRDMVGIDTERRVHALGTLLQPLSVGTFQGDSLLQYIKRG